jgi:hypothetical protein
MAGEQTEQHTLESEGAGGETDKKLIFGKYKTMEDAEKAHKDLERGFHESRQKESRFEERLELLENSRDEGYGRGRQQAEFIPQDQPDKTRILTEFYQNPDKVLADVEERATQKAEQRIAARQQQSSEHAARVQAWTEQNQDVTQYPELLTYWVGRTDGRLSIETRLSKAAEKVRSRVLELKGKPVAGEPEPDVVIEGVDQSSAPAGGRQSAAPKGKQVDPESELASYASQRNRLVRKPLGIPRAKA